MSSNYAMISQISAIYQDHLRTSPILTLRTGLWSRKKTGPTGLGLRPYFPYIRYNHYAIVLWIQGVDTLACSGRAHPSTSNLQKIGIMCKQKQKPQVRLWKGKRKSDSVIQHFGLPLCSLWWQMKLPCII